MTGFAHVQFAFRKVYVLPLQRKQLPDAEPSVKAKENAEHLWTLIREDSLLNFLLFGRRKAFNLLFRHFGTFDLVGRIFREVSEIVGDLEGALDDCDDRVHRICGQAAACPQIAGLHKFRDIFLQNNRRDVFQHHIPESGEDMLRYDLAVSAVSFLF